MSFFEKLNEEQHTLWVEKYRPWRLEDYVGNDNLKSKVSGYIQSGDIPHLLFYGKPGTGKCLDYSEMIEIEMDVSDDEYELLKLYVI